MSISQLFHPNGYVIHCDQLISSRGVDSLQNLIVETKTDEIELLNNTINSNIYPVTVTGSTDSTYRVEYHLNLFLNGAPGCLIEFEIMRDAVAIFSYNVASTSGTIALVQQMPAILTAYDKPGTATATYSLRVTTADIVNPCYISSDSMGVNALVVIQEVYPVVPVGLASKQKIITRQAPPEYIEEIQTRAKLEKLAPNLGAISKS